MKNRQSFGVSFLFLALVHRINARFEGVSNNRAVELAFLAVGLNADPSASEQGCSGSGEADHK